MRSFLGGVVVAIALGGCGDDGAMDDADTGSVSASGSQTESTSGSATAGETTADPGTESASSSASATESGTTGGPMSCYDATDVNACNAASGELETCLWLPANTVVGGGDSICEPVDVEPSGACVIDEAADGCGVSAEPTCPDELTSVWYREVGLEIGAVEVIAFAADSICETPASGFAQCEYDAESGVFTPPECACGCPMG